MIVIESKRKKPATILKKYPDAILADVTSGAKDGLIKLSPFYPHGGIPVPFSEGHTATCVEYGRDLKCLKVVTWILLYSVMTL